MQERRAKFPLLTKNLREYIFLEFYFENCLKQIATDLGRHVISLLMNVDQSDYSIGQRNANMAAHKGEEREVRFTSKFFVTRLSALNDLNY